MTRIALLGCGTVGRRIAEILLSERESIAQRTGIDLELSRILVRDAERDRGRGIDRSLFTTRFEDILTDPDLQLVIEVIGGLEPAREYVSRVLGRGVQVVTANKSLVAHHGTELRALGKRTGVALASEASVCAAVPVLSALRALRGDRIRAIRGIINGTCNFILSTMSSQNCSLEAALVIAQRNGLAEPDPSADLGGADAAEKLCVLADAVGIDLVPDQVQRAGIEAVATDDLSQARQWGFDIKCLAELDGEKAFAGPVLVPRNHELCRIRGADNALVIDTERGGEITLRGRGAGPDPTAAAIIGDVISVLRNEQGEVAAPSSPRRRWNSEVCDQSPFFVRIANGKRIRPAEIIDAFRKHRIEIAQIECKIDSCAVLTRSTDRRSIGAAMRLIRDDGCANAFIAPVRFVEIPEQESKSQATTVNVQVTNEEFEYATACAEAA